MIDDRDDERLVLDQLREVLEGFEKKQNTRMMLETGMVVVGAAILATVLMLIVSWKFI